MNSISARQLTGRTKSHLAPLPGQRTQLHADMVAEFQALQRRAAQQGFDLQVASGFRSFERQLAIWNAKASGQRPVLDSSGRPLAMAALTPLQQVQAIMRWSALPGASRHHWGTEVDIWDRAAVAPDYQVQLVSAEYAADGPFGPLSRWLRDHMADNGFYLPYGEDRGGVAPEPWHLSYRPLASEYAQALTPELLHGLLSASGLGLKSVVLEHLDSLFDRYITLD